MAADKFDRRRNAIACEVHQRYLEKSKHLTLDTAIEIGRMFEATKDGMQVMTGEKPRVEVNKVTRLVPPQPKKKKPPETSDQQEKCGRCGYRAHKP